MLTRLSHPHLVRAYETFEQPQPVLILETLTGATLDYLIGEKGRLRLADIAILGSHLCSAMHYLHRQGWLHLDLKPTNIISACGLAKVIDLSLAHQPGRSRRVMGTRLYMAPEQVRRELLSEATDVWGIGGCCSRRRPGRRRSRTWMRGRTTPRPEAGPSRFGFIGGSRLPWPGRLMAASNQIRPSVRASTNSARSCLITSSPEVMVKSLLLAAALSLAGLLLIARPVAAGLL